MTPFSVCSSCQRIKGEAGEVGGVVHTTLTLLGFLTLAVAVRFAWLLTQILGCSVKMLFLGSRVKGQIADASLSSQRKSHPATFIKMRSQLLGGKLSVLVSDVLGRPGIKFHVFCSFVSPVLILAPSPSPQLSS